MTDPKQKHTAILLLGPTGSGKTPLGELLEKKGLWNRRCIHFDFGANLRDAIKRNRTDHNLSCEDLEIIVSVLDTGALLENKHFPIAKKILRTCIERKQAKPEDYIVLNGMPRHVGQAEAIDSILEVKMVVQFHCTPEIVFERIENNSGGDRSERTDDSLKEIKQKLMIYSERTIPLIEHYRRRKACIKTIEVGTDTQAEDIWAVLNKLSPLPHSIND